MTQATICFIVHLMSIWMNSLMLKEKEFLAFHYVITKSHRTGLALHDIRQSQRLQNQWVEIILIKYVLFLTVLG